MIHENLIHAPDVRTATSLLFRIAIQSRKVHQAFTGCIIQTWLNTFNFPSEMVNLSYQKLQALENYLYTCNYFLSPWLNAHKSLNLINQYLREMNEYLN
jgi:hypothetical protein